MDKASNNSQRWIQIPSWRIVVTADAAWNKVENDKTIAAVCSGIGCNLTVTLVIIASVPSLPHNKRVRS